MKKLLAIILLLALAVSIISCNEAEAPETIQGTGESSGTDTESEINSESESETESEIISDSESESESEIISDSESKTESESVSDSESKTESVSDSEPETESEIASDSDSESSSIPDDFVPPRQIYDLEEYNEKIYNNKSMGEDFVYYDEISFLGEFYRFEFESYSNEPNGVYYYRFGDEENNWLLCIGEHKDCSCTYCENRNAPFSNLDFKNRHRNIPVIQNSDLGFRNDILELPNYSPWEIYVCVLDKYMDKYGALPYEIACYYTSGHLRQISWFSGNMNGFAGYTEYDFTIIFNKPIDEYNISDELFNQFLHSDTIQIAVNTFVAQYNGLSEEWIDLGPTTE